ncbi:hypothetical protein O181_012998 [Austropuccinia psidii MF-1]|uniref:Uncharacterized protein n=1 Tax=Austropuccinia psidii MF-1 TaxID=1389203 RepID=A0A9Q3BXU7_9BASI|nr:hypothetical protein [Austropuccinia psidii MF-1]
MLASNTKRDLWRKEYGNFGKELPVSEAPTPDGTSGYFNFTGYKQREVAMWTNVGGPIPFVGRPIYLSSEVLISRINTEGVVKRIRQIAALPPDHDSEGSDELDGEEVEVAFLGSKNETITHSSAQKFAHGHLPETPTCGQFHWKKTRLIYFAVSCCPRVSEKGKLAYLATREDPNGENKGQDAVTRLFKGVDRNIREVIEFDNDRTIPVTACEEMDAKLSWYEDELIDDFQRAFDDLGRDN